MLKKFKKDILAVLLFAVLSIITFWPFFSAGKIPLPGDIILGGYYPWQDLRWDGYSTIFPILNPTISDSVTSFYPWKYKSFELLKQGKFPLFDDSSYMGGPLFGTGTTGLLYPLNFLFLILSFKIAWSILTILTPFLAATFFYLWIKNKNINYWAAIIGGICYAFSSFIALQFSFINSSHSVLWLPLILFCIDKLLGKFRIIFLLLLIFGLFSSINAGFFQGSLYIMIFSLGYLIYEVINKKVSFKKFFSIVGGFITSVLLSAIQILPFIETTIQSSRVSNYGREATRSEIFDFFVQPYYLLTTFIPNFFGNPGKKNYWGDPNYYEFNNFVGTLILLGFFLIMFNIKKLYELRFFVIALFISVLFVTPNLISEFPYINSFPILSSLTPSRLLLITQFCLIVIGVFGIDTLIKKELELRNILFRILPLVCLYILFIIFSYLALENNYPFQHFKTNWEVTFRNTILSSLYISIFIFLVIAYTKTRFKLILIILVGLTSFELIKQTSYFRPFIKRELLYPNTLIINSLIQDNNRFMIADSALLPSNLQSIYGLEAIDGVSPLFSNRYNQFIYSLNIPEIKNELSSFSRTVFFTNQSTPLINILNIRYILSLEELNNPNLKLKEKEFSTYLYENTSVLPKIWIVKNTESIKDPIQAVKRLKEPDFDYKNTAIVSDTKKPFTEEKAEITNFKSDNGTIEFKSKGDGVAVLSFQYLPEWRGYIDNKETQIYPVNYGLMGITLPQGDHQVLLKYQPRSFKIGLIISLISAIVLISITAFWYLKDIRNKKPQ